MSRRWLGFLLLLSVGMNVGILSVLALERLRDARGETATPAALRPAGDPAAGAPVAGPPDMPPRGADGDALPPGVGWRMEQLAERLGLEGERRERFLEIQRRFFATTFERRARVLELQERFRRELAASEPSPDTIRELVRRLGEERAGLDADLARSVLDTRELLDPEEEREYLRVLARLRPGGPGARPGPGPGERPGRPRRAPGR